MANLAAIGFTVSAGLGVFTVSLVSFGIAVKHQSTFIAARCEARPPTVIYNPKPTVRSQDRGSPLWGWIPWVMSLTYATMLSGVPGTGTREKGLSGLMLKVNLDGIVLMRFHHLCLRVCSLAVFLYVLVALPIFKTAQCSRLGGDYDSEICWEQNLTDYQRLTLANIPPLDSNSTQYESFGEILKGFFGPIHDGVLARLYVIVFITWIVNWYAFSELSDEWRDVLAMRRVYFLEADHWADRNAELQETLLREANNKDNDRDDMTTSTFEKGDSRIKDRPPWIPHPETRDTVPNIELYSVLVGKLPSLPTEAFVRDEVEAVFSQKQAIDWQLAVTAAFFDHCVPNQPGFSSSVAAVTILPAASQITEAWSHWYTAAAKLRRLRFIRRQIAKLRKNGVDSATLGIDDVNEVELNDVEGPPKPDSSRMKKKKGRLQLRRRKQSKKSNSTIYSESAGKTKYYQEVLGSTDDLDVENNLLHALKLGPEQTAVYSREFAQGAANLAPYGFNEQKVRQASLPALLEMEKVAQLAVEEANIALQEAQDKIADRSSGGDAMSDVDLENVMRTVSLHSRNSDFSFGDTDCERGEGKNSGVKGKAPRAISFTIDTSDDSEGSVTADVDPVSFGDRAPRKGSMLGALHFDGTSVLEGVSNIVDKSLNSTFQGVQTLTKSFVSTRRLSGDRRGRITSTKKFHPGDLTTAQLPGHLGLEAGLFLKNKKDSLSASQHGSLALTTRRKSGEDLVSMNRKSGKEGPPQRSKSSDGMLGWNSHYESRNLGQSSQSGSNKPHNDTEQESHLIEKRVDPNETPTDTAEGSDTIWDKIAKENTRRSALRERVSLLSRSSPSDDNMGNETPTNHLKQEASLAKDILAPETQQDEFCESNDFNDDDVESQSRHRKLDSIGSVPPMYAIAESSDVSSEGRDAFPDGYIGYVGLIHPNEFSEASANEADENLRIAFDFEEKAGLRKRQCDAMKRLSKSTNEKWYKVVQIVKETSSKLDHDEKQKDPVGNGKWKMPTLRTIYDQFIFYLEHIFKPVTTALQTSEMVDQLASESHYAVVTFTSRQAAVAARRCLADSRGADRWDVLTDMPTPPLADAPSGCSTSGFRGCVRPVTISINDKQKMLRHYFALCLLGMIYFFYTIPLTQAQQLLSPQTLGRVIEDLDVWLENSFLKYIFTGLIPALVWTAFFAICPPMFKAIANFGSNATSSSQAEGSAMNYFWWFMVVSAFTGTSLSSAIIDGFQSGQLGSNLRTVVVTSAAAIPTEVSGTWLNWMIVRLLMVLPTQYLLQLNTFIFTWCGLKCCARAFRGGGSGGPVPYRIYIDSSVVMLCLFALAPASPLISVAAFTYFVVCVPILRWSSIFLYKPRFDTGGKRFPFCFDMLVSGMLVGNILLLAMMVLRRAFGPAVAAFAPIIPTISYRIILRGRYLDAFDDVALLQTSLLDGWDTNEDTNVAKREEFRQFLVDSHKGAYVPVCIAGEGTTITSEPAVVIPLESDVNDDTEHDDYSVQDGASVSMCSRTQGVSEHAGGASIFGGAVSVASKTHNPLYASYQPNHQPGRIMRRTSVTIPSQSIAMHVKNGSDNSFSKLNSPPLSERKLLHPHSPMISPHQQRYLQASPKKSKAVVKANQRTQPLLPTFEPDN